MSANSNTIQALNGIPFDNLIGSPLNACIKAQAQAAETTVSFIQEVGLKAKKDSDGEDTDDREAVYVTFSYTVKGQEVKLSVPLLTIIPIPYIAIEYVDIKFLCKVNAIEVDKDEYENNDEKNENENTSKSKKSWWSKNKTSTTMQTSVSSKSSSKGTQESQYSIESTIDVHVHAKSDGMPAGMAKVLEMLNSSIEYMHTSATATTGESK
ncbi:MAG: DUF2589 domain-containing protein [Bacteroidales bacterium]|nr:DUF2589 domain-containing protein [Bacteroidales bacterium]